MNKIKAICGICGVNTSNEVTGYCSNNHDYWIEGNEFGTPELLPYVNEACKKLGATKNEIINAILSGSELSHKVGRNEATHG